MSDFVSITEVSDEVVNKCSAHKARMHEIKKPFNGSEGAEKIEEELDGPNNRYLW